MLQINKNKFIIFRYYEERGGYSYSFPINRSITMYDPPKKDRYFSATYEFISTGFFYPLPGHGVQDFTIMNSKN